MKTTASQQPRTKLNRRLQSHQSPTKSQLRCHVLSGLVSQNILTMPKTANGLTASTATTCQALVSWKLATLSAWTRNRSCSSSVAENLKPASLPASCAACANNRKQHQFSSIHLRLFSVCHACHGSVHSARLPDVTSAIGLAVVLAAICLWLDGNQDDVDLQKRKHRHRCCSLSEGLNTTSDHTGNTYLLVHSLYRIEVAVPDNVLQLHTRATVTLRGWSRTIHDNIQLSVRGPTREKGTQGCVQTWRSWQPMTDEAAQ